MLLSIVISTYRRPESLGMCLGAIAQQVGARTDIEVIAVDDGSPADIADQNRRVCQQHGAAYVRHDRNRGMAVGRNTGLFRSCGGWVVFLDDDVRVGDGWLGHLIDVTRRTPPDVVGIEGKVVSSGDGLWDREVQNLRGGLYLTCHMAFRREGLLRLGGLDPHFEFEGPYCEDHELAARALRYGDIVFDPGLVVTHMPRTVRAGAHLRRAYYRMSRMLNAEFYFHAKQPDRYHQFRHSRTFWGTYRAILARHLVTELHRRTIAQLTARPGQAALLVAGAILEQLTAWIMLPHMIARSRRRITGRFTADIDKAVTSRAWGFPEKELETIRFQPHLARAALFVVTRRPVYDMRSRLGHLQSATADSEPRLLIRVDDVFYGQQALVEGLCEALSAAGVPWLAAVKGDDLTAPGSESTTRSLRASGAAIALHGFRHDGRFGPFRSEILQMRFAEIDRELDRISSIPGGLPSVFVPPFNAVSSDQILHLSRRFAIVCGGPETVRFAEGWGGAVALKGGGWYIPSLFPYYWRAGEMLRNGVLEHVKARRALLCLTFHLDAEARDGFRSLRRLLGTLPSRPEAWDGPGWQSLRPEQKGTT